MKKIILLLSLSVFSLSTLFGQIKLDRSDFSYAPATFQMAEDTNATLPSDFALGGPNKTWDLSSLANHGNFETRFMAPSETNGGTEHDSCNLVIQEDSRYGIYRLIQAQDKALNLLGQKPDSMGASALSKSRLLQFPLRYGDGWNDSNSAELMYPGSAFGIPFDSIKLVIHVSIDNVVDAWGKLKLPVGEADVLRLKTNVFVDYTAYVDNGMSGWVEVDQDQQSTVSFTYYSQNCGYHLANISEEENGYWVEYRNSSLLSTATATLETPQIYPNPVNSQGTLWVDVQEPLTLKIYSADGKLIRERSFEQTGQANISTADMLPGTYFMQFTNRSGQQGNSKLIVQ